MCPVEYEFLFPSLCLICSLFLSFLLLYSIFQVPGHGISLLGMSQVFSFTYSGRWLAKASIFSNFMSLPFPNHSYYHLLVFWYAVLTIWSWEHIHYISHDKSVVPTSLVLLSIAPLLINIRDYITSIKRIEIQVRKF